jgi:hypothetical protein
VVSPNKVEVDEEPPSADAKYGKKKDKKTKGKVTETSATVDMVMDADPDEPNTFAQAFIQDTLLYYTYNTVQEGQPPSWHSQVSQRSGRGSSLSRVEQELLRFRQLAPFCLPRVSARINTTTKHRARS